MTVTLSSWAISTTGATTYDHPITVNLYKVTDAGAVGDVIKSVTQTVAVPFRPAANTTCADPTKWLATDGICYNGMAFNVEFDLGGVAVPDEIIFGVAYNTAHHGYAPLGVDGPYDSLNVGLDPAAPATGQDVNVDSVFWNTSYAPFYTDGGAAGVGVFRADTGWDVEGSSGTVAARFTTGLHPVLSTDVCRDGGYVAQGFRNQGQCVASFVASDRAGK